MTKLRNLLINKIFEESQFKYQASIIDEFLEQYVSKDLKLIYNLLQKQKFNSLYEAATIIAKYIPIYRKHLIFVNADNPFNIIPTVGVLQFKEGNLVCCKDEFDSTVIVSTEPLPNFLELIQSKELLTCASIRLIYSAYLMYIAARLQAQEQSYKLQFGDTSCKVYHQLLSSIAKRDNLGFQLTTPINDFSHLTGISTQEYKETKSGNIKELPVCLHAGGIPKRIGTCDICDTSTVLRIFNLHMAYICKVPGDVAVNYKLFALPIIVQLLFMYFYDTYDVTKVYIELPKEVD